MQRLSILIAILFFQHSVYNQLIGDECIREYDNASGKCKKEFECPKVQEEYKSKRINITECAYMNGESIICCPENSKRISEQKCEEYREPLMKKISVWGLLLSNTSANTINTMNCDSSTPLITGGNVTKTGEFPHMAAIGWRKSQKPSFECGGILISDRYVLTAAHCEKSDGLQPSFVRLGDQNLRTKTDNAPDIDVDIMEFIRHPKYSSRTDKNDIALIKLQNSVKFSKAIRPACLWQTDSFSFTKAVATGWGALEYGTETSEELMKVELDILDNDQCNRLLSHSISLSKERFLDDTQVCSGVLKGGRDTCQGDSGGPLQISFNETSCLYHIIGITSYGSRLCGTLMSPAVYTKVSSYLDWIEDIVWK